MNKAIWHACVIMILGATGVAQEFPIAVGPANTFGSGAAYDGTKFLFAIQGNASNRYSITVQVVSMGGTLVGPQVSLDEMGSSPMVAFDGTNFLVAWTDSFPTFGNGDTNGVGNIYGRFVNVAGMPEGSAFTIVQGVNIKWGKGRGTLTVQDTTYFLTYTQGVDHHTDYIYGLRLNRSGVPVGAPIQISEEYGREVAVAFDGTNYLVAWCRIEHPNVDRHIWGQFVSKDGVLVGSNFIIDGGELASDNPVSMAFDGTKYWVGFHEQAADATGRWNLFARFVSTAGTASDRFMICDSSKSPTFASAAFGGGKYLVSWMEFAETPVVRGRFMDAYGTPLGDDFTLFDELEGKFPLGGVAGFVVGQFVLSATRTDGDFLDGDVYGMFLPGSVTGVDDLSAALPLSFRLHQNHPNPFNPTTRITFTLEASAYTTLRVYDILGREVATLLAGIRSAGPGVVEFDASRLPSGVYLYQLRSGTMTQTRRMTLAR